MEIWHIFDAPARRLSAQVDNRRPPPRANPRNKSFRARAKAKIGTNAISSPSIPLPTTQQTTTHPPSPPHKHKIHTTNWCSCHSNSDSAAAAHNSPTYSPPATYHTNQDPPPNDTSHTYPAQSSPAAAAPAPNHRLSPPCQARRGCRLEPARICHRWYCCAKKHFQFKAERKTSWGERRRGEGGGRTFCWRRRWRRRMCSPAAAGWG
jgi:hypothetical protein